MLSNFDLVNITVSVLILAMLTYTAYKAFSIWRATSVGPFRNQAIGIGLLATSFAVFLLNQVAYYYIPLKYTAQCTQCTPGEGGPAGLPTFLLVLLLLFYEVDSSVPAGRRLDPLHRDTLRWSWVRIVLWPLIAGLGMIIAVEDIVYQVWRGFAPGTPPFWVPAAIVSIGVPLILGLIMLPLTAWRAKDSVLRIQLAWFGLFAILFFLGQLFLPFSLDSGVVLLVFCAFFLSSAYCLLMSARSLAESYSHAGVSQLPSDKGSRGIILLLVAFAIIGAVVFVWVTLGQHWG
jgi:uncharacterized membrane protein